jgi:hypothetical protein
MTAPTRQDATVWTRLAASVPSTAIQWRPDGRPVTRNGQQAVRQVAYIDTQLVRERLDAVVPGEWDLHLEPLPPIDTDGERLYAFRARLSVLGVEREDVGQGKDYKAAASDAFKRAAVRFGIAHELYALPARWGPVNGHRGAATPSALARPDRAIIPGVHPTR